MDAQTVCPRCGARDSFMKGYLPETCVCRVCQSQLDWREIPGCGPDCVGAAPEASASEADQATEKPVAPAEALPGDAPADAPEADRLVDGGPPADAAVTVDMPQGPDDGSVDV